jgi:hypothetical protein
MQSTSKLTTVAKVKILELKNARWFTINAHTFKRTVMEQLKSLSLMLTPSSPETNELGVIIEFLTFVVKVDFYKLEDAQVLYEALKAAWISDNEFESIDLDDYNVPNITPVTGIKDVN